MNITLIIILAIISFGIPTITIFGIDPLLKKYKIYKNKKQIERIKKINPIFTNIIQNLYNEIQVVVTEPVKIIFDVLNKNQMLIAYVHDSGKFLTSAIDLVKKENKCFIIIGISHNGLKKVTFEEPNEKYIKFISNEIIEIYTNGKQ